MRLMNYLCTSYAWLSRAVTLRLAVLCAASECGRKAYVNFYFSIKFDYALNAHLLVTAFDGVCLYPLAYYAIPVAIFILVAILLVICVTLWVVPYCVDHQRKRKRQTDAAKSTNQIYDDDDDEISTGEDVEKGRRGIRACETFCYSYFSTQHTRIRRQRRQPMKERAILSYRVQLITPHLLKKP